MENIAQILLHQLQQLKMYCGWSGPVNSGDLWALGVIFFLIFASLSWVILGRTVKAKGPKKDEPAAPAIPEKPRVNWQERLGLALSQGRQEIWGKIGKLLGSGNNLTASQLDEMEELLYSADLGPKVVSELMLDLQQKIKSESQGMENLKTFLRDFLWARMHPVQSRLTDHLLVEHAPVTAPSGKPIGVMIVGVNGAGKTTTIGKLATKLTLQGAQVVVGAGDTFRAAAVDQLQIWCERAGAQMIRGKEGSRPSGVAFESLQQAMKQQADYCILDTAGRLHTNENLMEELKKIKGVWQKMLPGAPHHIWLVLDAISGQNSLRQAEEFHRTLGLTGIIFTKCDGSAKAGGLVGIVDQLQVPAVLIGIGEKVEDLAHFSLDDYLTALLN